MLGMLHAPSRAYIDPWTGQFFGEGGVEQGSRNAGTGSWAAVKGAKGGVIMPKLGNETAKCVAPCFHAIDQIHIEIIAGPS